VVEEANLLDIVSSGIKKADVTRSSSSAISQNVVKLVMDKTSFYTLKVQPSDVPVEVARLGQISADIAFGGNFFALCPPINWV